MVGVISKLKVMAIAAGVVAGVGLMAQPVQAESRVSVGIGFGGGSYPVPAYQPAYCPPTVTYALPPTAYYTPAPTYYYAQPAPTVVYAPAPVYYSAPAYYAAPRYYSPFSFDLGFRFGGRRHW